MSVWPVQIAVPASTDSKQGLGPADRLRHRRQFEHVYAQRRRGSAAALTVFVSDSESGHHRLGMAVARRVGPAVQRNRIKRRLREVFRLNRHRIHGCYDIVVHPRPQAADLPFPRLTDSLLAAVRRAAQVPAAKPAAERTS